MNLNNKKIRRINLGKYVVLLAIVIFLNACSSVNVNPDNRLVDCGDFTSRNDGSKKSIKIVTSNGENLDVEKPGSGSNYYPNYFKGDTLRIVHNTDQEAIATSLNGSDIVLLSFKNTSPSVQLYQSCQTGVGSTNKIGGLTGGQYASCRSYYIEQADEIGISVVYD